MALCQREDGGRTLFGWFDLTPQEKEALIAMLKQIFGEDVQIDMKGLRKMFATFLTITDPATMDDRDATVWGNVANEVTKVNELKFNEAGRRAWYNALKKEEDPEWEEGKPPDKAQQYFLTKLRTVATRGVNHLRVMEKRWEKGEQLVTWYKSFRKIANTRGPGQTVLNLQLG